MNIYSLIPDIQYLVGKKDGWFTDELAQSFGEDVARRLKEKFNTPEKAPTLRLSKMGPKCPKALWHSIHTPGEDEALPPWAEIKFCFGHILEALVLTLAKAAGHEVTGEQDEISVDGVKGHRDCVIDGAIVDIKSASSLAFKKFKDGSLKDNDSFGYLEQLDSYVVGSADDPLVRVKDRGYIVAIDKTLGHMALYEHKIREVHIRSQIRSAKAVVGQSVPPVCTCRTLPEGKSGNIKLAFPSTYSQQKFSCFPNLRTFIYASGPLWLTKVVRKPDVPEVDRYGKPVY